MVLGICINRKRRASAGKKISVAFLSFFTGLLTYDFRRPAVAYLFKPVTRNKQSLQQTIHIKSIPWRMGSSLW